MQTWTLVALLLVAVALVFVGVRIKMLHDDVQPILRSNLAGAIARI